jgi:hypothetical protein
MLRLLMIAGGGRATTTLMMRMTAWVVWGAGGVGVRKCPEGGGGVQGVGRVRKCQRARLCPPQGKKKLLDKGETRVMGVDWVERGGGGRGGCVLHSEGERGWGGAVRERASERARDRQTEREREREREREKQVPGQECNERNISELWIKI